MNKTLRVLAALWVPVSWMVALAGGFIALGTLLIECADEDVSWSPAPPLTTIVGIGNITNLVVAYFTGIGIDPTDVISSLRDIWLLAGIFWVVGLTVIGFAVFVVVRVTIDVRSAVAKQTP